MGRAQSSPPPDFNLSPTLVPDASAAIIPSVLSAPLTTTRGVTRMAYPTQTNTPPTTPTQRMRSWRRVVVRWCCVIASGFRPNLKKMPGVPCLCGCSAFRCIRGFGGVQNGGRCRLLRRRVGTIGVVPNLFWREVRWGVRKRSGTYVRLWIRKSCPMVG